MAESKKIIESNQFENIQVYNNLPYTVTKRVIDASFSAIGLILLLPIFIIVAVLIKIEDRKGSVFFSQERVGKDGKVFYMYKFRSMVSNAEDMLDELLDLNEANGPLFKMKEDPRVTKIGRFIRKTSIDELPQLLNVLTGEMSLVGPRPALPREVATYSLHEKQRLKVLPGLTCFWQVEGRSNVSFEEQVFLDLKYIKNRSVLLDFSLIFRTIKVLFGSKDAY